MAYDVGDALWRRSSYSGNTGGDCVEVADLEARVAVRDSKNPEVGVLTVSPKAYAAWRRRSAVCRSWSPSALKTSEAGSRPRGRDPALVLLRLSSWRGVGVGQAGVSR
ncbi:DUF397 domain-containing protein [Streptomyces sp. NPDC006265]|uniref:DUF397 domain-containing protein n=1 Tax=Streptomyces sp. NPDC006265 TaxID=3156740 RepID=UPI00339F713D